jgi:hypothetical protein
MVLFQMFHLGNSRSEHLSVFRKNPLSNPFLLVATTAAIVVHVGALYFGPTQLILRVEPLDLDTWGRMAMVAASILVVIELHKLLRRGATSVRATDTRPARRGRTGDAAV